MNYFCDNVEIVEKIKLKEYGYENFEEIVVKFNEWYKIIMVEEEVEEFEEFEELEN